MKKFIFGKVEEITPSKFCKGFNYIESDVAYDISKVVFKQTPRGCVLEFPIKSEEQIYGLGLQLNQFNWKGKHAKLRVNSDPLAATGDSHAPVPFFVSTAGYGIYFDTARYIEFDFGRKFKGKKTDSSRNEIKLTTEELYNADMEVEGVVTVCVPVAQGIEFYIIEGETITDIVSQYNRLSGGGCDAPEWGLGLMYRCCGTYTQEQVLSVAEYLKKKDIPCSIIGIEPGWQTRAYSCSFKWNEGKFPKPQEMIKKLYEDGYHVNLWEHAYIHPESEMYDDLLNYSANYTVWNGLVPDFSMDKAKDIFAKHHNEKVDFGLVDGYKLDECDSSDYREGWCFPDCTEFPSGMDGEQYHCLFGTLYMQSVLQSLRGKATLSEVRNAGALASSYPFVLYSDLYNHSDFIRGVTTSGFSGLLWSPEVRHADSKDEFIRRLQSVVFSIQCLINGWYCEELPWLKFDCEDEVRYWIKERQKLIPLLNKAFKVYKETGKAPIRALVSDYTQDRETYFIDDEYVFCDELIVAPIAVGQDGRKVYLPQGNWVNYFTGEKQSCGWFDVKTNSIPVYKKVK